MCKDLVDIFIYCICAHLYVQELSIVKNDGGSSHAGSTKQNWFAVSFPWLCFIPPFLLRLGLKYIINDDIIIICTM